MEMESMKEKLSCNLWFSLPDMKVSNSATVWNGSEKFMSVKIHVFKKAPVAKLYSDIRIYFAKQREIGLFYLIAESGILQFCFY